MRLAKLLIILFLPLCSAGQVSVDSLERLMNQAQGEEQLNLMIRIGNIYSKSDPEKSLEYGLKAAFIAKRVGNQLYEGQALLLMGLSSLNSGQQENALRYYNRALTHFEKANQSEEQIIALDGISRVYSLARNYELATRYLERALDISKQLNKPKQQIELHQRIGDIALEQKNYSLAFNEFSMVLSILESNSRLDAAGLKQKAKSLRQLGYVYRNLGQFDESLTAYRNASKIDEQLQLPAQQMKDNAEIAFSFFLMQKYDSALVHYNRVLGFYQLQNDSVSMIGILRSIGDVFFELEQYRQAVASYNQSFSIAQLVGNVQEQVASLVNISRCYSAFNDYPSSKDYLNKALELATRENLTNSAADVYMYLSQVNEAEGKHVQALDYYKMWAELRDSIYSEESGQKLARMQILYEITQKERENEILKQNSEIQDLQLTKTRYQRLVFIAIALSLFILLVFFALYFSFKQREFIKQKETELRIVELNKELEKRMISEIKKQEKQQHLLAQKSKLESLGTLAAGIAHEINQPLGGISMGLDNILIKLDEKNYTETYLKEKMNLIFNNVDRIKRIIDHVRTFSRTQKPSSFERVNINEVVSNSLSMVSTQFRNQGVEFDVQLAPTMDQVIGDKFKLEQVVLNLLNNAKFAVDEKAERINNPSFIKKIYINTWTDQSNVFLTVKDNGIGIKPKDVEKIFDPFFTTKKADKGTGLGLSISYSIIKDLLGEIRVESKEDEFTRFEIVIPKT